MTWSFVKNIYDPILGRNVKTWILEIPGAGCEHYKKTGGCTMCGFNQNMEKYNFGGKLLPWFFYMILFYIGYLAIWKYKPEVLVIYNGGSFLNDREIPKKTQMKILQFVRQNSLITKIMVETRANYATAEKLALYKKEIGDKILELAFGLESVDDMVRNVCLKKGLRKKDFESAVAEAKALDIKTFTYIYLKPHCFEEKEAVEDAIKSIEYCFSVGVDEVSLSCAFIQRDTLLFKLWNARKFIPPTLWSIIEVIQRTSALGPVRIGSFDDEPPPLEVPHNCQKCNDKVMSAIEFYRSSHYLLIFNGLDCECKT